MGLCTPYVSPRSPIVVSSLPSRPGALPGRGRHKKPVIHPLSRPSFASIHIWNPTNDQPRGLSPTPGPTLKEPCSRVSQILVGFVASDLFCPALPSPCLASVLFFSSRVAVILRFNYHAARHA